MAYRCIPAAAGIRCIGAALFDHRTGGTGSPAEQKQRPSPARSDTGAKYTPKCWQGNRYNTVSALTCLRTTSRLSFYFTPPAACRHPRAGGHRSDRSKDHQHLQRTGPLRLALVLQCGTDPGRPPEAHPPLRMVCICHYGGCGLRSLWAAVLRSYQKKHLPPFSPISSF